MSPKRPGQLRQRLDAWNPEVVSFVTWTIAWAVLVPYLSYVVVLVTVWGGSLGIRELLGAGQAWLMSINILAAIMVDIFRGGGIDQGNSAQILQAAVLCLLIVSVIPWAGLTVQALDSGTSFDMADCVLGGVGGFF